MIKAENNEELKNQVIKLLKNRHSTEMCEDVF